MTKPPREQMPTVFAASHGAGAVSKQQQPMTNSSKNLCLVPRLWLAVLFALLLLSLVLNLIVAVGNWHLYARVERLEAILLSQATPQSQQTPLK